MIVRENITIPKGGRVSYPPWSRRLTRRILSLRADIGRIESTVKGTTGRRGVSKCKRIRANYMQIVGEVSDLVLLDHLKLRLAALAKREQRYKKNTQRRSDQRKFSTNERGFYRELRPQDVSVSPNLQLESIYSFWSSIWGTPANYNTTSGWLTQVELECQNIPEMINEAVTVDEVQYCIRKAKNWKAPGPDEISNFWYKKFDCIHQHITDAFQQILTGDKQFPTVLCEGKTVLLPKRKESERPDDTRPITCLSTMYKYFTGVIANRVQQHIQANDLIAFEQRGCTPGGLGCKEHLTVDAVITGEAVKKRKSLYMAYIDYRKAFDSVPHSWIIWILRLYKVDPQLIRVLVFLMSHWRTRLCVGSEVTDVIAIQRGIFQGDAISSVLFCLSMNPLSTILRSSGYGYELGPVQGISYLINHLLYVDDLKLLAQTEQQLQHVLGLVTAFSRDISMSFGLDKCKLVAIVKGKVGYTQPVHLAEGEMINALRQGSFYKYLGFAQTRGIAHKQVRQQLIAGFTERLTTVVSRSLTGGSLARAVNTFAISLLTYSFGVIKWTATDLDTLNRLVRTKLTAHRKHHPKASLERVTLPRTQGGRGIIDVKLQAYRQVAAMREYFYGKAETSLLHRVVCEADQSLTPLTLSDRHYNPLTKVDTDEEKWASWAGKPLHGKHLGHILLPEIDGEETWRWLTRGNLYAETEGFVVAAQDGVLPTRNYIRHIVGKKEIIDKCRRCGEKGESIEHILAGCKVLAPRQYLKRHNLVATLCYRALASKLGMAIDEQPYYRYEPPALLENTGHKLYWDRTIPTDMFVSANRPDVIWHNKGESTAWLIDVAVPLNTNLVSRYIEKIEKYQALALEIKAMWRLQKVNIIPLVISVTGVVPRNLQENLRKLGLDVRLVEEMQKAVLLQACNILRRFLGLEG